MPTYTKLKGITNIGDSHISDQLKSNIQSFLDWGFLEVGAFFNINGAASGSYGGDFNRLRLSEDRNYTKGRVWEGSRINWVWETGLEFGTQPIQVSGVTVNNTFYPSNTTGSFAHIINYPLGQVIFNSPIASTSTVKVNHSFKYFNFYTDTDIPWFKELQADSFRVDSTHFLQYGSGNWSQGGQNKLQMPAVVIQSVNRTDSYGKQLGGGQWVETDLIFRIFAQNSFDRDKLIDIIRTQKHKTILTYNKNTMAQSGVFPLNVSGSPISGFKTFPYLVENYFWKKVFFKDMKLQSISNELVNSAIVRGTFELDCDDI